MITVAVIHADTGQPRCHRFLPMRAALALHQRSPVFYYHHGPLCHLVDAATDPTGTHQQIRHALVASHDRSGTVQISIDQPLAMTSGLP
ncbi:MAG: hypothetical protein ACREPL_04865 [Rhodanobacteraceae bacterium]